VQTCRWTVLICINSSAIDKHVLIVRLIYDSDGITSKLCSVEQKGVTIAILPQNVLNLQLCKHFSIKMRWFSLHCYESVKYIKCIRLVYSEIDRIRNCCKSEEQNMIDIHTRKASSKITILFGFVGNEDEGQIEAEEKTGTGI